MTIILEQFDGVVADLETAIVSDEIGYEQAREFVVDVGKFEDGVDDFRRSGASA